MSFRLLVWSCSLSLAAWACSEAQHEFSPANEGGEAGRAEGGNAGRGAASSVAAGAPSASGGADGEAGGAGAPEGEPGAAQLACTERQLLDLGRNLFSGSTVRAADNFNASCFSGNSNDLAVEWIAPAGAYYRFTTAGSSYDTALALLDDQCDGDELACNADPSVPQVELVRYVEKDARVVVVVDGKAGATGNVRLGVEAISCPGLDLNAAALPVELTTQNQGDNSAACGGAGKSDRALRFTAPSDGLYRFSAKSPDFGAIVSVEDGPICGSPALACGYSFREGQPAQLVRRLSEGQPVSVFVDGGNGTFELDVEDISEKASCPSSSSAILLDNSLAAPFVTSFVGATHLLTGSCSPTGDFTPVAAYAPVVERSFPLAVNLGPDISCDLKVTSASAFAAYLLAGAECAGPELECAVKPANGTQSFTFDSSDNGDYVLVVEDVKGVRGKFEISFSCII